MFIFLIGICSPFFFNRLKCSLFDVSHMPQVQFYGENHCEFLNKILVGDVLKMESGDGMYSLMTNEKVRKKPKITVQNIISGS